MWQKKLFSKTTYMKLYIYDIYPIKLFLFSDRYSTPCNLPREGFVWNHSKLQLTSIDVRKNGCEENSHCFWISGSSCRMTDVIVSIFLSGSWICLRHLVLFHQFIIFCNMMHNLSIVTVKNLLPLFFLAPKWDTVEYL